MVHSTYSAQQNYFNIRFQKVSAGVIRVLKGMVILNKLLAQAIVFLEEHIKSASVTIISFLHESIPPVLWLTGYKNHGFTNNFVFTEIFTKLRIRTCYTVRSQTHPWLTDLCICLFVKTKLFAKLFYTVDQEPRWIRFIKERNSCDTDTCFTSKKNSFGWQFVQNDFIRVLVVW